MSDSILLPTHNLHVIDFEKIYNDKILHNFFAHLNDYKLTDIRLANKDIRKLLYHGIIHALCEEILHARCSEKVVVFYSTSNLVKTDLNKYIAEEELILFIEMLLRKVMRLLPVRIFITSHSFKSFVYLVKKNEARGMEILYRIKALIDRTSYEQYTFRKIRIFTQKYGLTFLSDVYFNAIKSKQLLLR